MATKKLCSVDGCGKPARTKSLCSPHYRRLLRHGNPLGGGTSHGAAKQWLLDHRDYNASDECLLWPFACTANGYAFVRFWETKSTESAARVMCMLVNGPPPKPWYHASHLCGKGHHGCVHPRHLSWKTPADNHADKRIHGTSMAGQKNPSAKLSDADVAYIRSMKGEVLYRELADKFGVSSSLISRIISGHERRYG
jgi:hypothetical protein